MKPTPFLPFNLTLTDLVEMLNAVMLVVTGYLIGHEGTWYAIATGACYAAGKRFVEIAKAKTPPDTPPQ